jgi:hypothetical protein
MISPESIFRELVEQITSTGETWFPFYGEPPTINEDIDAVATSELDGNGDPIPVTLPCAILLKPVTMTPKTFITGHVQYTAPLFIYILYDTDADEYTANKQILIDKARVAAYELKQRFLKYDSVDSITSERVTDFDNTVQPVIFDRIVCGVTLELSIVFDGDDNGCFTNEDLDVVNIYDEETEELIASVPCRTDYYIQQGGGEATVTNSDDSYTQTGESPLELPDTTYNIYVNGVLDQSFTVPTLKDEVINIEP